MSEANWDEPVSNIDADEAESADEENTGPGDPVAPGESIEEVDGIELALEAEVAPAAPNLSGLADAAEASRPRPLVPESVIGDDERRRITTTNSFPWRVHASLLITARDGSRWIGTAFFIGRRVLATAGHNIFINGPVAARNGWVNTVQVMPGRDGNTLPFGSATSTRFFSVRGWTHNDDDEYDYGAIVLGENDALGDQTGWLGYGAYADSTISSSTGNLSGYPGDRGNGEQQWYMARRISSVSARKVFYDIDTAGGQSGSAVYRIKDGKRHAFGIHAYGVGQNPLNSATRITRAAFDNLKAWKAAHP